MRYDVKKFLFVGLESERDVFFKSAQDAGRGSSTLIDT